MIAPAPLVTIRRLYTDIPLLAEGALAALIHQSHLLAEASVPEPQAAEHPSIKRLRDGLRPAAERNGNLAVVPVQGALLRRPDPWEQAWGEAEDTDAVRSLVDQVAADSDVAGILLDVDSPGGFYGGGPELADAVRAARSKKPVVAWTGGTMASLAYWVGSQANQVVASRSAAVGSIGVYIALLDWSRLYEALGVRVELFRNREGTLKAAGLPGTSLSEPQREHFQERAQSAFAEFKRAVRSVRPGVPDDAMKGQTLNGTEAKAAGLVDRIGDRSFALSALRSLVRQRAAP